MKKTLLTLMCLAAMLVAGTSIEAQVVTIPLNSGWTWISYPRADTLSLAAALGEFVPEEGDIIKSQYGYTMYSNGYWSGGIDCFYPGLGYMYKSMRNEPVPFGFPTDELINPDYVPIDWDDATLVSSNDSTGIYEIQFDGEVPELYSGSIITIDQDTVVHHLFVETVSVNGNTVSVTSTEAYLTDIFACTDFTLTTATNSKSSAKGKVFYPVAAYQYDKQGIYKPIDLQSMRDNRWSFTHNLWHYGQNYDGDTLFSGNGFSIYMEQLNFDLDLDLEIYMNFSGRYIHEIVGNAIDRYRSQALVVDAALLGTFNTEQKVRCDIEGSCSYSPGYDIWKHNLFRPLRVRFMVYGVPVIITLNSDLYRQVELSASGEISAYAGFSDNAQGRVGFEWRQTGGISPLATFSNTFELTPPTVEGQGTVEAKAWAFPRVRSLLYDVVGPSFDFKPYLSTTVSGGFKEEMLGQSNDFCAWSLDCNVGLDAAAGLSLQFMGYETQNYSTPNWNIIDRPLYHSPLRIEHNAAKGNGMKIGQRNEVSFTIYDRNHLFNMDVVTPLPQFVKFEGDGEISSEYGMASGGTVSVDWTPSSSQDVLYARLYDTEGNVISEAEVDAEITVTTASVTNVTQTSATGGGTVTGENGSSVTERGICWSTSHNPTISNSHASSGSGTGSFTVNISGLTANTTYYVRAYATNSVGTEYGNEVSFTTQEQEPTPGDWVDLGLPSGLLWATCNVGANSPEDYGDYYAWGETTTKSDYRWSTYQYCNGGVNTLTKYCNNSNCGYNGYTDNLTILQPGDDAATANYGGRMPTTEEWQELRYNCSSVWTTRNGVNGRLFTGPNGNTLFLPFAGDRWDDELSDVGIRGRYWSSSLYTNLPSNAWSFYVDSAGAYVDNYGRLDGISVRAVREN